MTKDEEGCWTVTTPSIIPGIHFYYPMVDGARFNDPFRKSYGYMNQQVGAVEVPEPGVDFYDAKDVPHGQVRLQTASPSTRRCVYSGVGGHSGGRNLQRNANEIENSRRGRHQVRFCRVPRHLIRMADLAKKPV
jgi:hypothetical protein